MRLILTNMQNVQIADEIEGTGVEKGTIFLLDNRACICRRVQKEMVHVGNGLTTLVTAACEPIELKSFKSRWATPDDELADAERILVDAK